MSFLNSNVEVADRDTIREITLLMKQTGCDVHAIGDGGFGGGTWPENLYQMSITLKGKAYTWAQMATPRRWWNSISYMKEILWKQISFVIKIFRETFTDIMKKKEVTYDSFNC